MSDDTPRVTTDEAATCITCGGRFHQHNYWRGIPSHNATYMEF